MNRPSVKIDALLEPLLTETNDEQANELVANLISLHAEPVIKNVIRFKLRLNSYSQTQRTDADDVQQEALLQLVAQLQRFRKLPEGNPITDMRGMAAVIAHRTCARWMRRQFPERHALKNRLHYLLTRQRGFSLWQDEEDKLLAGFAVWQQQKTPINTVRKLSDVEKLPVRVVNSTFEGNKTSLINSEGGGIYHYTGNLHVTGSMLTGNEGFGVSSNVANGSTVTTISDSTISGNLGGPGISLFRVTLNVSNSTIANNESGGIRSGITGGNGTWTVKSSIIAANGAGFADVTGAFTSAGFNLIGNPGTSTGFVNGANNDQVGTSGAPLDPKLDPLGLKDNGGTTHTIALQADSPAIDQGSEDGLTGKLDNDQRQVFVRSFDDPATANAGDGSDIGAFELQPGGPTPTPTPTPSPSPDPSPSPSPTPTPTPQLAKLVVTTTSLVRSNCGSIAVGVTVQNIGGATANNVKLTTATLTQPTTNGAPLPQSRGSLAPGQWATTVVTFSGTNNAPGQKRTLTLSGIYDGGGTFSGKWKVTLP